MPHLYQVTALALIAADRPTTAIAAVIGALGTFVVGLYTARAVMFKQAADKALAQRQQEIDKHGQDIEGVKTSVSSLQMSNAELRIDNTQLRTDLAEERDEMRARDEECRKRLETYATQCDEKIRALETQIKTMGGTPK